MDGAIGGAIFAWLYNLITRRGVGGTELDKKTIIAIAAVGTSVIIGCITLWQVSLYRSDLRLKYSPYIYPVIKNLNNANDPQLLIFNFGEPTEIIDYEITFRDADSKKTKTISEDDLGEAFKIKGKKLPKRTSVLYFRDKKYTQFLYDYLKDNDAVMYCDGYIKVQNKMSSKVETFNIKCKRSLEERTQEIYWHPDPGPYH